MGKVIFRANGRTSLHSCERAIAFIMMVAVVLLSPLAAQAAGFTTVAKGNAQIAQFPAPLSCSCHSQRQSEWQTSMHARALTDKFYLSQIQQVTKDAGAGTALFCHTCHAPGAVMTGSVEKGKSNEALNGITCTVCHQVTRQIAKTPGNTSLGYAKGGPDGVLRAQLENPTAPHSAETNKLYNTSEYCGACHDVTHPTNGLKLETTYAEWKASSYAKKGTQCQNCHMAADSSFIAPFSGVAGMGGASRDNIFAMTFVGANVAQGDSELSTALLKKAAKVSLDPGSDILPAGEGRKVTVRVENVGAGHDIPTGLTEVRNMWLEISAIDAAGSKTILGKARFGTDLVDAHGKSVGASFWRGVKTKNNTCIKAGETYSQEVSVKMPTGATNVKVVAELEYQSAQDDVIKSSGVKNPTTTMASADAELYASEQAKQNAEKQAKQNAKKQAQPTSAVQGNGDDQGVLGGVIAGAVILIAVIIGIIVGTKIKRSRS